MLLGIVRIGVLVIEPGAVVVDEERIAVYVFHAVLGIVVRSLEHSRRLAVLLSYRRKAAQPVLVMQRVDVLLRVCCLLGRWRTVEVGYLAVQRSHRFVSRKRQADAFPRSVIVLCVRHRLAHIPCTVRDVEGDGHAEVVVKTFFALAVHVVRGAFHEVKERRCVTVVRSLDHVMTLYERLPCGLFIAERILHDVISLIVLGGVVGCRVDEEVLRNACTVLYAEVAEDRSVVVHRRIEDAFLRHAHCCGKVALAGEVDSRCLIVMHVRIH